MIYTSAETDPYVNLALEEWLFRARREGDSLLFVYRNEPSVIIGRNQVPWLECHPDVLTGRHLKLARRVSGGGAVYHDGGNLNIAFIVPRSAYDPDQYIALMAKALRGLHIPAELGDRHTIWAQGCKITGSAFLVTGASALIHACLLVHADLSRLRGCLGAPGRQIRTRATPSVPAPVANLTAFCPGLHSDQVAQAVTQAFADAHDQQAGERRVLSIESCENDASFREYLERNRTWQWVFGRSPEFAEQFSHRFCWGAVEVLVTVCHGLMAKVECRLDRTSGLSEEKLASCLCGVRYDGGAVAERLNLHLEDLAPRVRTRAQDLAQWLAEAIGTAEVGQRN